MWAELQQFTQNKEVPTAVHGIKTGRYCLICRMSAVKKPVGVIWGLQGLYMAHILLIECCALKADFSS